MREPFTSRGDGYRPPAPEVFVPALAGGETSMTAANDLSVRRALELAGVEFIDENGGGAGVRLRKPQQGKQRK
jgi:hypothetical protein